ncbi:MAG: hypothetical protein R2798_11885 [Chitinophagales bacterium]|nr:hypothetical protein [Bacteroidota bacterium]MCB9043600.1 hypothetical protein [Chitinophagales bacterium]
MLKYNFNKWQPFSDYREILQVSVEEPYSFLGDFSIGYQNSAKIQLVIDGITRVMNNEEEDFFFRNDAGFFAEIDTSEPNVYIFDEFSEDPTKELFTVPYQEMLQLLEDFKAFLIENGR